MYKLFETQKGPGKLLSRYSPALGVVTLISGELLS
jgi:hypothetical protein